MVSLTNNFLKGCDIVTDADTDNCSGLHERDFNCFGSMIAIIEELEIVSFWSALHGIKSLNKPQLRFSGAFSYPLSMKWFQPSMAFKTGSDKDTRRGTEGAHTSRHTEPRSVPSRNSTIAQVLPNADSLPSTKKLEQSLDTCG